MSKKSISVIILVVLSLIYMNFFAKSLNQAVYSGEELSSNIVGEGEKKYADESTGKTGYLTYGPYYRALNGNVEIDVYYKTDTEINTVEVFGTTHETQYAMCRLSPSQNIAHFSIDVEPGTDYLEIRTAYNGEGYLQIDKVCFSPREKDLYCIIVFYDVCFVVWAVIFIIVKKNKRKTND